MILESSPRSFRLRRYTIFLAKPKRLSPVSRSFDAFQLENFNG